jgi:hypothetical protein
MLKAMLVTTAMLAARTPAPPLMPQNQGMGPVLIAETNRIPGRKSKAHQEACRRQDEDTKAGANKKICSIEVEQERQPERQRKQISGTRHAPGYKLASSVEAHALGCHAAEACPKDQAEQDDTERVDGMAEEDAHSLRRAISTIIKPTPIRAK